MTKRGRPKQAVVNRRRTLFATDLEWQSYGDAAETAGVTRPDWMRGVLNEAARTAAQNCADKEKSMYQANGVGYELGVLQGPVDGFVATIRDPLNRLCRITHPKGSEAEVHAAAARWTAVAKAEGNAKSTPNYTWGKDPVVKGGFVCLLEGRLGLRPVLE